MRSNVHNNHQHHHHHRRGAATSSPWRTRLIVLCLCALAIVWVTEIISESSFMKSIAKATDRMTNDRSRGRGGGGNSATINKRRRDTSNIDEDEEQGDEEDLEDSRSTLIRKKRGAEDVNEQAAPWKLQGKCGSKFLTPSGAPASSLPPSEEKKLARIAYFITVQQGDDMAHLRHLLIRVLYDPQNFYIIHMDSRMSSVEVEDMRAFLYSCPEQNAQLLEPALTVRWGSFSVTLMLLFAMGTALQMSTEWDYFINLSAGDFPMGTQIEIRTVLGLVKERGLSFMDGSLYDWDDRNEDQRELVGETRFINYADDEMIHNHRPWRKATGPLCDPRKKRDNERPRLREVPTRFQLMWGSHWMVLHRKYVDYLIMSPDNVARSLIAYFAYVAVSAEEYFHTVLCHPDAPDDLLVYGDSMRFRHWAELDPKNVHYQFHYHPLGVGSNITELLKKGALFARTFDPDDNGSREAMWAIEDLLKETTLSKGRIKAMTSRIAPALETVHDKYHFCNASRKLRPLYKYKEDEVKFRSHDLSLLGGQGVYGKLSESEKLD